MLDHIGINASDLARSRSFYSSALAPLGASVVMEVTPEQTGAAGHVGYGTADKPVFWVGNGHTPAPGAHIAFVATDRAAVDAFYAAAMAAGGTDNGAPGLRPGYHPNYYAAFVLDPDGHNIEAVCHTPA